jgi:hypothetical protein
MRQAASFATLQQRRSTMYCSPTAHVVTITLRAAMILPKSHCTSFGNEVANASALPRARRQMTRIIDTIRSTGTGLGTTDTLRVSEHETITKWASAADNTSFHATMINHGVGQTMSRPMIDHVPTCLTTSHVVDSRRLVLCFRINFSLRRPCLRASRRVTIRRGFQMGAGSDFASVSFVAFLVQYGSDVPPAEPRYSCGQMPTNATSSNSAIGKKQASSHVHHAMETPGRTSASSTALSVADLASGVASSRASTTVVLNSQSVH